MLKLGSSWDSTRGMDLFDPSLETVKDEMSFKMSGELSLATPQSKLRAKWLDSNPGQCKRTQGRVGCWRFVLGGRPVRGLVLTSWSSIPNRFNSHV